MNKDLNHILTDTLRKDELVGFLKQNPHLFEEAVDIALGDYHPQSWRAAWLVKHYMKRDDERLKSKVNSILKVIPNKGDGHQRELLKILMEMNLSEKQNGILFDNSMNIWEDINKSSSVRGYAFSIIINIVKKYPELINETRHLTQSHFLEPLSPGIRSSIEKIIKEVFSE